MTQSTMIFTLGIDKISPYQFSRVPVKFVSTQNDNSNNNNYYDNYNYTYIQCTNCICMKKKKRSLVCFKTNKQ